MKLFASIVSVVLADFVCPQETAVVLPTTCQQSDGRSGGAWPGFTQRFRMQMLLHERPLRPLRGLVLRSVAVRRDGQYQKAHAGGRADVTITMSHAAVAPDRAHEAFASNRGPDARVVFQGRVQLPDAPPLLRRDDVSWQLPHVVEFPFTSGFSYQGGPLCLEIDGAPDPTATARWWRIDYDLFTHDAQADPIGTSCDPRTYSMASRPMLLPGGTLRLVGIGPLGAAALTTLGATQQTPPIPLDLIGATGCDLHVAPAVVLATSFRPPVIDGYGGATISLSLPKEGYLLGASLHAQMLAYPNPINPAQLTATNALRLTIGSQVPALAGVIVRTGIVPDGLPMPATGSVLPHLMPVLCLRGQ